MKIRFAALMLVAATLSPPVVAQVVNPGEIDSHLAELAIEAANRGPVTPIPLRAPDGRVMGAVYDHFLTGAVLAKAALGLGRTAQPDEVIAQPAWQSRATTVVAYPTTCDGKPNPIVEIRWKNGISTPVSPRMLEPPTRGARHDGLPGVALPDDAMAARFVNALTLSATVEVDYRDPWCQGAAKTASFSVQTVPSRSAGMGINGVKLPAGQEPRSPTTVRVRAEIDPAGRPRFLSPSDGPPDLTAAAVALLQDRSFDPATINGTPMPMTVLIPVVFTADGAPGVMTRPSPPASVSAPGQMTTSRVISVPVSAGTPVDMILAQVAAARARQGDIAPIPLDSADRSRGFLVDGFLIGALRARAALKSGTPIEDAAVTPALVQDQPIVVALPLTCGGRTVPITDIDVSGATALNGSVPLIRVSGPPLTGNALASRLPGLDLPPDAVGRVWLASANPFPDMFVNITYAEGCEGAPSRVSLPVRWTRVLPGRNVSLFKFPDGATGTAPITVQVRGVVDEAGKFHPYAMAGGPVELQAAAFAAASGWSYQPARVNTTLMPGPATAAISFNATGAPSAGGPPAGTVISVGAPPPGTTSSDGVMMSTTVAGRSTEDFRTADAAGLTPATSQCTIANDAAYGVSVDHAIKVGGDAMRGPARERAYLAALRGPNGEGLRVVRRGSLRAPDGTILDLYEVAYTGQSQPLRLYLDEYHEATLQAPQGLVCAAPLAK